MYSTHGSVLPLIFKTNIWMKKIFYKHANNFFFYIARDVGGEHENVYNLNILLLELKYAFRKNMHD